MALILSIAVTFILQYVERTQIESLTINTMINVSNEIVFGRPYEGFVKKGYFDSVASVYIYLFFPYSKCWDTFNAWMSLDNSSWISVPFLDSITENYDEMANLGLINLGNPELTIYQKYYVPPQDIILPPNVTKQDLANLKAYGTIRKQPIPLDTTQWILAFFAVFGFIGFILTTFFSGKDSSLASQKIVGKKKKKSSKPKKGKEKKKSHSARGVLRFVLLV